VPACRGDGPAFIAFNLAATAIVGGLGGPEDRTANFYWLSAAVGNCNFAGAVMTGHIVDAIGLPRPAPFSRSSRRSSRL